MRDIPEDFKNLNSKDLKTVAIDVAPAPAAIEVRQLSKRVADASGELTILHNVNFTVQPAETLAIVGASGSGKSTLLGLLAGLDSPSNGTVILDGVDIFALDEDGRARLRMAKLGFVFQSFQLLAHLTALENVMLPLELRGDAGARGRATEMLGRVGLSSRLKHYPKFLSGGEQQRVALARAFVTEPPLLFADEPTGSLDAATGEAVIQLMFELNRERGSTLVLVTHDTSIAARCDRTITIAAGRLVQNA
ncbi:ABC transporter ATP-binding protein [Massilia psychrophila]|uniref:ABC transporter ATP-binding protein n=1 Tax=Massilia psychrophila TaxID=1603353 RepID=UPI0019B5A0A1|nr:ABC transporter ATP-binding protein [Massilia psychrophila]GGE76144.1 ABC transporter ATP-binding protein [Massilia psychrophila]